MMTAQLRLGNCQQDEEDQNEKDIDGAEELSVEARLLKAISIEYKVSAVNRYPTNADLKLQWYAMQRQCRQCIITIVHSFVTLYKKKTAVKPPSSRNSGQYLQR